MFDRETLELLALESVCACRYYDLADCLGAKTNGELMDIIESRRYCHKCQ